MMVIIKTKKGNVKDVNFIKDIMVMIKTVKGNVDYAKLVRRRNIKDMMMKKKWDVKNAKKKTKLSLETLLGSVRFVNL